MSSVTTFPVRYGICAMTAGLLRQRALEFHGHARDAFQLAANYVQAGSPIPTAIRNELDTALAFNQDRYGK